MPKYAKSYSATATNAARKQNGLAALRHNHLDEALTNFQKLTAQDFPNLPNALAEVYFRKALNTTDDFQQLEHLQAALRQTPKDGRLYYHQGRCYQRLGNRKSAESAYATAQELGYTRPGVGLLRALLTLLKKPNTTLEKLAELTPEERTQLTPLSLLLRKQPQSLLQAPEASWFAGYKTAFKAEAITTFWQGLAHYANHDLATAANILNGIAPLALPAAMDAIRALYLGQTQLALGEPAQAQTTWQSALQRATKAHLPHRLIERLQEALIQTRLPNLRALLAAGQWAEALRAADAALTEAPKDFRLLNTKLQALDQLAQVALAQGQWTAALPHLEAMRDLIENALVPGTHIPIARNLAIVYEALERWADAADAWHWVLEMLPTREAKRKKAAAAAPEEAPPAAPFGLPLAEYRQWVRRRLLLNYQRAGDPGQAITLYKQAIKAEPDDLELRFELANALLANDQELAARNELNRILERNPQHHTARIKLAEVHMQRNDWVQAEALIDQVLATAPGNLEAQQTKVEMLRERGHTMLDWGAPEEAKRMFTQAVALAPQDMELHISLGDVELKLDHPEAAQSQFETVLGFNKVAGYIAVFESWVWHKDETKAREVLARAETAGLTSPAFYAQAAAACYDMTHDADAMPFASFFGLKPRKKKTQTEIDHWSQWGAALLKQAETASPNPTEALQAIVAQLAQRHPQLALTYIERLVALKPNDPQVLLELALLQAMNNQRRPAKDTLKKALKLARASGNTLLLEELEKLEEALDMPQFGIPNFFLNPGADDFEDDFFQ